ncbi:hypothetical protein [Mycobacterium arosiense]|nr:hypothetical protein [Mycobacterium arosiense]
MPLQPWMQLISADDHLIEHPKVRSHLRPQSHLATSPKIIEWSGQVDVQP